MAIDGAADPGTDVRIAAALEVIEDRLTGLASVLHEIAALLRAAYVADLGSEIRNEIRAALESVDPASPETQR